MSKLNVLSLFSGIGAYEKALTNIGVDYDLTGFSEVDRFAIESYCAIHGVDESLNLGDISKIKESDIPHSNLVTFSFPCTDISVAGEGKGINKNTRSGLLYEAERIINHIKPEFAIAENVRNLVGKRHKEDFDKLLDRMYGYGYNNYWTILNASEFGVPQNRERVFIVSIRKDIDDGSFEFPVGESSDLILDDMLETVDNPEFKLSQKIQGRIKLYDRPKGNKVKTIGSTAPSFRTIGQRDLIYSRKGNIGTLVASDYKQPKQIMSRDFKYVRKITPLECFRLMGFTDKDFHKIKGVSNTQLYKQAGNSVVVSVLEEIFKNLLL